MRMRHALLAVGPLTLAALLSAQSQDRTTEPRPVDPATDPVNQLVAKQTVSGLIVGIVIDGRTVTLERAQPARIRKPRVRGPAGDTITVSALRGASIVSTVTVADPTVVVVERQGLTRPERRTVYAALPTPRAIDAITVTVGATGATARFDVRAAYDEICRALPRDPVCARETEQPRP